MIGPHSDGKTNLLNWLSSGYHSTNRPVTSCHFTNCSYPSCWSCDRDEVELVSFVNSYISVLVNNAVSFLTKEKTCCNVSPATIYTAFICDIIGYSEYDVLLKFLSANPITVVTFDVPHQQEELPTTTYHLCMTLDNIDHAQNTPPMVVLVGIHDRISCNMLDQCRDDLLCSINDKPYRKLLADQPSNAVIFYQCGSHTEDCPLKELIVDCVMKHHSISLSFDRGNMLQKVRDTGVVAMTRKEFKSYKGSHSLKQLSEDGVVCYFSDCPSLQDVVFTSPQWLNNIIALLTNLSIVKGASHTIDSSNGLLTYQLVDELLAQYSDSVSVNLTDAMMSLLIHVDLAVPQSTPADGAMLVPSLITSSCPPATLNTDSVFLFTVAEGNIARISSYQLLVKLLKWSLNKGHQLLR